jgi:hypothetical protein
MSGVCEKARDTLAEVAAESAVPPAIGEHLEGCPSCRGWLADRRRLMERIHGELEASLQVEPSPLFLARVRHGLDQPRAALRWWRADWLVAAAIALVVAAAGLVRIAGREAPMTATPAWTRSAGGDAVPPPPPAASSPQRSAARVTRTRLERPHAPEILVPPGQEALVRRWIEPIRRGRVDTASLLREEETAPAELTASPIEAIEIKPLAVEPLNEEDR